MYTINWDILFLIIICNGLLLYVTYIKIPNGIRRIYFIFMIIPTIIYSGIGISYKEIGNNYLVEYLIYSSTLIVTMFFGLKRKKKVVIDSQQSSQPKRIDKSTQLFVIAGTFIFFLSYIIFLFIPKIRVWQIINPPMPTVINAYEKIRFNQTNILLDIAQLLRTLFLPAFMMFLYYRYKKGKNIIIWILTWIYLAYLSVEYLGRYELVIYAMFIYYTIVLTRDSIIKAKFKQYMILAILFIGAMPFFLSYQFMRVGITSDNSSFFDAIKLLLYSETSFPKYYYLIPNMLGQMTPFDYFLFFILLPIPSVIFSAKGDLILSVNEIFTTNITGLAWGAKGYSGLLPTIFGESILIFGENFYFIHAIIIGVLLSILCRILENKKNMVICNIYFAISCISIARGGSQGYFGMAINSLIAYFIVTFFIHQKVKNRMIVNNGGYKC